MHKKEALRILFDLFVEFMQFAGTENDTARGSEFERNHIFPAQITSRELQERYLRI